MDIFEALEALKDGKIIKKDNGNTLYKLANAYYGNLVINMVK